MVKWQNHFMSGKLLQKGQRATMLHKPIIGDRMGIAIYILADSLQTSRFNY